MSTLNPKFYNKNGDLSVYSFACGYIQQYKHDNGTVELYKDGIWHIKLYDSKGSRLDWLSYDSLTTARRDYALLKTRVRTGTIKVS